MFLLMMLISNIMIKHNIALDEAEMVTDFV